MKDIVLIGGGGHCKSVIDVIEQEGRFKIIGIVELRIDNDKLKTFTFKFMNLSPFSIASINKSALNLPYFEKSYRTSRESGPK